jgi:hypothetical protein
VTRWPVGKAVLLLLTAAAAVLLYGVHPVLALAPLVIPGAPAALMLAAQLRYGDPYAVSPRAAARDLRLADRNRTRRADR